MWSLVVVTFLSALFAPGSWAISRDDLYTHGAALDDQLPRDNEVSSTEIQLKTPIIFYGEEYNTIYVNNNGLLSFRTDIPTFINVEFPLEYPVIAPLYANVDTRSIGTVYFRETQDAYIIAKATEDLQSTFPEYYEFVPLSVFIATWADVGYHKLGSDKYNTFQSVVISNGTDSFAIFLYPEDGLQWIQGSSQDLGLPDARAQVGFVSGDGRFHILKGSGTDQIRNIISMSNTNEPGKFVFRIGNLPNGGNVEEPQQDIDNGVDDEVKPESCSQGGSNRCHLRAQCVDYETGFCCTCDNGFYGNGKSCLKNDVPVRVTGKVSGELNGHLLDSIDLQAYVVMADGRTYTALSKVPEIIGGDMQTLNVIGGVIGWLFARPVGNALNGYQLTGGIFNHTANIIFPITGHKVTIRQKFTGLDVFDQLKMEAEIKGSIPAVLTGSKLELLEYDERYTQSDRGTILSDASRTFTNRADSSEYLLNVQQSFIFNYCQSEPFNQNLSLPLTLKVAKNFIGFESREKIIRYGMSNKIVPMGQEDPCVEGKRSCVDKSTCVIEGDSFKCVCISGYQFLYQEEKAPVCIDINECSSGTHSCDSNAQCINQIGSFGCQCNPGYEGNGVNCEKKSACETVRCDPNAQCLESYGNAQCQCNEGFTGDGNQCWPLSIGNGCRILQNCSPFANCLPSESTNSDECQCFEGYEGDGYNCSPIQTEQTTLSNDDDEDDLIPASCILGACWCSGGYRLVNGYCYPIENVVESTTYVDEESSTLYVPPRPEVQCLQNICFCPLGFTYDQIYNVCLPTPGMLLETKGVSGSILSCNIINKCHPYAQCVYDSSTGQYQCLCSAGYEGDGIDCREQLYTTSCEYIDNYCDVHATCGYDPITLKSVCVCNPGYEGDGKSCHSVADCLTSADCEEYAECRLAEDSQRYECLCLSGFSKDANEACVPDSDNCNGATCAEHATCQWDPEFSVYFCQCDAGYQGTGVRECVLLSKGCDIANDCDKNAICGYDPESTLYKCFCKDGYQGDGYSCSYNRSCNDDPYICSPQARCKEDNGNYICQCNPGFTGNGTICKTTSKHESNFLLLNQGMATLRVPFNPTPSDIGRPIQLSYYQMAIGLDIDCNAGRVYWSDISGKTIKSSNYDGTVIDNFLTEDIISPEGLSIDWVSRNIFWTDSRKDTIEVANLDSRMRKVLFRNGLVDPRGIAVHPQRGKIFWSDWNRKSPKIEWSNMDGSGRSIFLRGDAVLLPNSLSIDWAYDRLCYADAGTKKLECVQIDTLESQTVASNLSYPFGMAITDDHFYWTDWTTQKIEGLDRRTSSRIKPIPVPLGGGGNKLYGMAAVANECPRLSNICQHQNGNCPAGHLCLPDGNGGRRCLCGSNDFGPAFCNEI